MTETAAILALLADKLKDLVKRKVRKWAEADARDRGEWRGKATFKKVGERAARDLGFPLGVKEVYRVVLDPEDPLRFFSYETGHEYRASLEFVCNMGSIPRPLQPVSIGGILHLHPLDYWKSYSMHDDVYRTGGIYVRDPEKDMDWVFVLLERAMGDLLLYWGLGAEDANNATLQAVARAVRLGSWVPWKRHRKLDLTKPGKAAKI
jgi:hypothetical protein